jgi:hypothetical protein
MGDQWRRVVKKSFKFIRKWRDKNGYHCEYEVSVWEGPIRPGQTGRYVLHNVTDTIVNGRPLNTAPSVSYYGELARALKGFGT